MFWYAMCLCETQVKNMTDQNERPLIIIYLGTLNIIVYVAINNINLNNY